MVTSRTKTSAPAARRTPTAAVRGALVDAAVTVLERDGRRRAHRPRGRDRGGRRSDGVYNHLDGKSGLLLAVLQRAFDGLYDAVSASSALPAAERLMQSGRDYRRFALAHPVMYALMFGTADKSAVDLEALGPHAAPAFQALVDVVAHGQEHGVIRGGDPNELALQIWSAVHGSVSLELTRNLGDDAGEPSYELMLEMIARGVAPD